MNLQPTFHTHRYQKGFSLIEVLIFITVMSLVFVTAAAVITVSLNNIKVNEHKIIATRHAEELMEWLRSERETGWQQFATSKAGDGSPDTLTGNPPKKTYCFNNSLDTNWSGTSKTDGYCASFNGISGSTNAPIYKREATLVCQTAPCSATTTQVNIKVKVSWQEGTQPYDVTINSSVTVEQ